MLRLFGRHVRFRPRKTVVKTLTISGVSIELDNLNFHPGGNDQLFQGTNLLIEINRRLVPSARAHTLLLVAEPAARTVRRIPIRQAACPIPAVQGAVLSPD